MVGVLAKAASLISIAGVLAVRVDDDQDLADNFQFQVADSVDGQAPAPAHLESFKEFVSKADNSASPEQLAAQYKHLQQEAAVSKASSTGPDAGDAAIWLEATNKFRCMHGSPPVTWNEEVAKAAQEWAEKMPPMKHANSYALKPPCGENLAMSMGMGKDVPGRVAAWYSEVDDCVSFPGCEKSKTPGKHVGHFSALVWKGVKEIGCGSSKGSDGGWYYVCRYASGPRLSYDTANMGGGFASNVFAKVKDESQCSGAGASGAPEQKQDAAPEVPDAPMEAPKVGSDADSAGGDDQTQWLNTTNKLRCLHGSPPVTWNAEVAKGAQEWAEKMPPMKHANSYALSPPCGENLAMNMGMGKDIPGRVMAWYSEVDDCVSFPGCEKSKTPGKHVGHVSALVWKGVKEIGCGQHKGSDGGWYYVCRYASGPRISFDTANMGGAYKKNVFAKNPSLEPECTKQYGATP